MTPDIQAIHDVLDAWARATREGRHDDFRFALDDLQITAGSDVSKPA